MGVIVKQSSLGLVANYAGVVLGFINVMLLMPAILEPGQIGLINLILSVAFLIYPLMDLSAASLLNRFFTQVKRPQQMLHLSGAIYFAGIVLFALLFYLGQPFFESYYQEQSPEVLPHLWLIFGVSIVMGWLTLMEAYAVISHKLHVAIFLKEVVYRVFIFFALGFLFFRIIAFDSYLYLHYAGYFLVLLILTSYLYGKGFLRWQWFWPERSEIEPGQLLDYGFFVLLTGLAGVLALRIDTVMLGSLKGLEAVGVYSLAMFMMALVDIPRRMVVQSSLPVIRSHMAGHRLAEVLDIQKKAVLSLLLICGTFFMLIVINVNDIYRIIPNGEKYAEGAWVVLFLGLAKMTDVSTGVNYEVFLASKHYRYTMLFFFLLAISTVGFNYLLIPEYGVKGAAFATFGSVGIVSSVKIFCFKRLFKLEVYEFKMALAFIALTLIGVLVYFLPLHLPAILSVMLRTAVALLMLYAFMRVSKISPELNQLFNEVIGKFPFLSRLKI